MVRDTLPSQDASTHQIWNSYLKEYRRYGPDTKAGRTDGLTDGRTDGRTVRLLYASQSSFWGIKTLEFRESDVLPGQREVNQGKFVEFIFRAKGYFRETDK